MIFKKNPPINSFDVAYTINNRDWAKVFWSVASILIHNPEKYFHFHVCIPLHEKDMPYIQHFKELQVIKKHIFSIYPVDPKILTFPNFIRNRLTHVHITKMFLAKILNVDRVLYLDSDTINIRKLDLLLTLDMKNYVMAGVIAFDLYPKFWINSGVIIYNLKELRENDSYMIYVNCTSNRKWSEYYDDAMHTFCFDKSNRFLLPLRYNVMMHHIDRVCNSDARFEAENAVILHFMHGSKSVYHRIFSNRFSRIGYGSMGSNLMEEFYKISGVISTKIPHFIDLIKY